MPSLVKPAQIAGIDQERAAQYGVQALYLFQEQGTLRDCISGGGFAPNTGGFTVDTEGTAYTCNGTNGQAVIIGYPNLPFMNATFANNVSPIFVGRIKATANQAGNPGAAFGIYNSNTNQSISQAGFCIGFDNAGNVGAAYLSTSTAGMGPKSPSVNGVYYTVYAQAANGFLNAWINGAPAATQATTLNGSIGGFNELVIGAMHRSAGLTRNFTGNILWAGVLAGTYQMTDDQARELYLSDFPYNLMLPKRGYKYWWKHTAAGTTVVPWPLWQRKAA